MGSGQSKSSQVQSVHIEQKDCHSDSRQLSRKNSKVGPGTVDGETNGKLIEAQKKIKELEKQLAETESENLDLQDRVQALECQLDEAAKLQTVKEEPEDLTETLKAKDLYIANAEKEKKALQTEFTKAKNRYRKRIKTLMSQVGEAKQEQSIQMFELRDEINKLREENQKAREARNSTKSKTSVANVEEPHDNNKMKIVLELSNQVSEQAEQITKLERENTEKQLIIDKLLSEFKDGKENKHKYFSSLTNEDLETEKEMEERSTLKKLSLGLGQYTKPPVSSGTENTLQLDNNVEEERNYSGASRDSGLGSAGKNRKDPHQLVRHASKLSALSDSDWESDEPLSFHSKVRSAPADTQGRRTASRCSTTSNKTMEDDGISVDDNASLSSLSKKSKKLSFLQRRFKTENGSGEISKSSTPTNAFEKEPSFSKERKHFFLTQETDSAVSEADSVPVY